MPDVGVEYAILGPLQVLRDGREVRAPGGRQRDLLARLACRCGWTLTREQLIDDLWGEALPANPTNALQQVVFQLRRTLEQCGATDVVVTTDGGYRLAVDTTSIDAARFEQAVREGEEALRDGDPETASTRLEPALALWRGEALQDIDAPWARIEARRLTERRLSATESLIEARFARSEHADCIEELTTLVAVHPLRERFRAQLMRALAAAGRQADALERFHEGRELLASELGIDPSALLQDAYEDVLHQRASGAASQGPRAPVPPQRPQRARLARPVSSMVGRREELCRLRELLATERLLTLTGPGGAGKSRLALELVVPLAEDVSRGRVHIAELAPLTQADLLVRHIAGALDLDLDARDDGAGALVSALADEPMVLVLDNAEHLVDPLGELVAQLVAGCPGLTLLVTSREPLGVAGEVVWPVPTLPVPPAGTLDPEVALSYPAVELFVERTAAVVPGYELADEDVAIVTDLVRALDGLPLAIELAAARTRALSLPDLAAQLHDRFRVLRDRRRRAATRHRALQDTVEWSWDLLTQAEQRAWMAAAVPDGGFQLDQLAALLPAAGADLDAIEAVTALCDRSLLTVEDRSTTTRYRMLETLRSFGVQQLAEHGPVEVAVRDAHAADVTAWLASTDRTDEHHWDVDVAAQLTGELDARTALRWRAEQGDTTGLQELAGRLGWLWYVTGRTDEGIAWLDQALGPPDAIDPPQVDPRAATWATMLRVKAPTTDTEGLRWAALALEATDDPVLAELARIAQVAHRWFSGDRDRARSAAAAGGSDQGGWLHGTWRLLEGQILAAEGSPAAARRQLLRAETALREHGAEWWSVVAAETLLPLLQLHGDAGAVEQAGARYLAACAALPIPDLVVEVELRSCLAMVAATVGRTDTAEAHLDRAARLVERTSAQLARAVHASATSYVRLRSGDTAGARLALAVATDAHDRAGRFFGRPFVLLLRGHLELVEGHLDAATAALTDADQAAVRQGVGDERAGVLECLAALCAARGEMERAALLLGTADAERHRLDAAHPVLTLRDLEPQAALLAEVARAGEAGPARPAGVALLHDEVRALVTTAGRNQRRG